MRHYFYFYFSSRQPAELMKSFILKRSWIWNSGRSSKSQFFLKNFLEIEFSNGSWIWDSFMWVSYVWGAGVISLAEALVTSWRVRQLSIVAGMMKFHPTEVV